MYYSRNIVILLLKNKIPALLIIVAFLTSCKNQDDIEPVKRNALYLNISHTRTNSNPNLVAYAENIDYSKFEIRYAMARR